MSGNATTQRLQPSLDLGEQLGKERSRSLVQPLGGHVGRKNCHVARLRDAAHLRTVLVRDHRPTESKSINQLLAETKAERVHDSIRIWSTRVSVRLPSDPHRIERLNIGQPVELADVRLMKQATSLLHLTDPGLLRRIRVLDFHGS
jgi:hypothetical protein